MAKKTIIPDFTLALGADLREAAAKMREMSRPPAHQAPSPAPEALSSVDEEARRDTPAAGEDLKNDEPAPKDASASAPLYVTNATPDDAPSPQSPVPLVQNPEKTAPVSAGADEAAPVFSARTGGTPDFSNPKTDDTATSKETTGSAVPLAVNDKKHNEEPALSSEKDIVASARQDSPLSEAAQKKDSVLLVQEPEAASLPSSSKLASSPSPLSRPQEKELSEGRDASVRKQTPAMNPPMDVAPPETSFTISPPPEERIPSPGKPQAAQEPLCPPQPLKTAHAVPESSVQPQEMGTGPGDLAQTGDRNVSTVSATMTVGDSHQLPQTDADPHKHTVTRDDKNDCSLRSSTVIDGHLQSRTVNESSMTVDDRHSPAAHSGKPTLYASPSERLTDVSPSFPTGTPDPAYGRSPATEQQDPVYHAASPQPEKTAASFSPQHIPSRVTMTVTDTNNISESQPIKPLTSTDGVSIASATLQEVPLGGARQTLLNALDTLRGPSPQVVVNLKRLAAAIGLSYGTVRNTISRLVREGIICTTQVRTGEAHGVCIEFLDDTSLQSLTAMGAHAFPQPVFAPAQSSAVISSHQQSIPVNDNFSMTRAMTADDTSIWSVDARLMADLWPYAAQAGLSPAHLAQIRRAYQVQGWDAGNVPRCLRYLDWELGQGLAAGPEHVAGWLRVMQRQGHYPRPEGYADPEVLRLQQEAEEQRELARARQDAADARAFLDATSRQR